MIRYWITMEKLISADGTVWSWLSLSLRKTAAIYSAFVPVHSNVRILPVGFASSDGSSAGTSAKGECAVWCSPLAVTPQGQLCQGTFRSWLSLRAGTALCQPGAERGSCRRWGNHSKAVMVPVQVWDFWSCPRVQVGLLCSAGCCRDPEELAAVAGWWWWCILPLQAAPWSEVTGMLLILMQSCNCCTASRSLC